MNYSLVDHNRNYQITGTDLLVSLATGCSGAPYAIRHHQLSEVENAPKWGHKCIALIEFVPVLGALVALVERVIYSLFSSGYSNPPWRSQPLDITHAMHQMAGCEYEAVKQRQKDGSVYIRLQNALGQLQSMFKKEGQPVRCSHHVASAKGPRAQMEDAHFCIKLEQGVLAGVFDGHGGKEVSAFAAKEMQKHFPEALKNAQGNIHTAFETVFHHIHQDIARNSSWNDQGSTAVVSYIDTNSGIVYTATLGDSEANIYRNNLIGSVTSIPLSYMNNWVTDFGRLLKVYGKTTLFNHIVRNGARAKDLYSRLISGVNVSRAFGDVNQTGVPSEPLVTHEPAITMYPLKEGDVVVLSCDGLKDFVSESTITKTVGKAQSIAHRVLYPDPRPLAQQLVDQAIQRMERGGDNVTVLAIEVEKASA